jgi:hypothetical protein
MFLANLSSLVECLWLRPRVCPRVKHLIGAQLYDRLLALFANIKLVKKTLPRTNTLSYWAHF